MKALLISPYWDVLGGGEKYLLSIGRRLAQKQYQVELAWEEKSLKEQILKQFGSSFEFITINRKWPKLNSWQRLLKSRDYDVIFYHSDGSYFFSLAKKNFQLFQVPEEKLIPNHDWLSQLKFSFWTPVFNSRFTARFFLKHVSPKKSFLLYPPTENFLFKIPNKQKLILSVGRFFGHLHSKKQETLIKAFIQGMKKYPEFKQYKLLLVGGLKKEDKSYFDYLQKLKSNYPNIEIKTNVSYSLIQDYYRKAQIYWHAAGYKVNEKKDPHLVEHFGISVVEAMAAYCVPIVYPAGGPKEIITDQKSGLFFHTPSQLISLSLKLMQDPPLSKSLAGQARSKAEQKFGITAFKTSLDKMLP